jgi:hypothetical protein
MASTSDLAGSDLADAAVFQFADFRAAILTFLREEVPTKWHVYCDQVTDNFRIISDNDFRILI